MNVFNPEMLVIARGAWGGTQTALAEQLDVPQGRISRWEDGLSSPSEEDVERIAAILETPVGFFYQSDVPVGAEVSLMYHRKRRQTKISDLHRLHCRINVIRMGVARLLRSVEDVPIGVEHFDVDEYASPREVARMVRAAWRLPATTPIRNLVELIESRGAIVIRMPFETSSVDAVHLWPWDMPPLVFLNDECPADRERFSLAHEIGHMLMHRIPTPNLEAEADEFASEFLLPESGLRMDVGSTLTLQQALRLKHKWRVSGQAIITQSKQIGAISARKHESLYKYLSKLGYRKAEPNPLSREQPTTLRRLIDLHLTQLGYSLEDLAESLFLSVERFRSFLAGDPSPHSFRIVGGDESSSLGRRRP